MQANNVPTPPASAPLPVQPIRIAGIPPVGSAGSCVGVHNIPLAGDINDKAMLAMHNIFTATFRKAMEVRQNGNDLEKHCFWTFVTAMANQIEQYDFRINEDVLIKLKYAK